MVGNKFSRYSPYGQSDLPGSLCTRRIGGCSPSMPPVTVFPNAGANLQRLVRRRPGRAAGHRGGLGAAYRKYLGEPSPGCEAGQFCCNGKCPPPPRKRSFGSGIWRCRAHGLPYSIRSSSEALAPRHHWLIHNWKRCARLAIVGMVGARDNGNRATGQGTGR